MRQTTSILFFARKTTQLKNGESPIFLKITINGKIADISLKRSIDAKLRDTDKNCFKRNNQSPIEIYHHIYKVRSQPQRMAIQFVNNELVPPSKTTFREKTKSVLF
ncbi:MAG: Arm DNA-binding domain-containing protein [Labilibaculum antarcticum]